MAITVPIERYAPTARDQTLLPFQLQQFFDSQAGASLTLTSQFINNLDSILQIESWFVRALGGGSQTTSTLDFFLSRDPSLNVVQQFIDGLIPGTQVGRLVGTTPLLVPPGIVLRAQATFSAAVSVNQLILSFGGFNIPRGNWGD